jgi:hypothetical protein
MVFIVLLALKYIPQKNDDERSMGEGHHGRHGITMDNQKIDSWWPANSSLTFPATKIHAFQNSVLCMCIYIYTYIVYIYAYI